MIFLSLFILAFSLPQNYAAPTYQPSNVGRSYAQWMADSVISRGQGHGVDTTTGKPKVSYEHGTFQNALRDLYAVTKEEKYLEWVKSGIDNVVLDNGTIIGGYNLTAYTLDDIRLGESFLKLYESTKEEKYSIAAHTYRRQLQTHPRNVEGGLWHKLIYPNQMWLDGLYMAQPFVAQYREKFENWNMTILDDVGLQFKLIWEHCRDNRTGLLRHGYDASHVAVWADPVTGASPEVWIRAVGWYVVALVDLLTPPSPIPTSHTTYKILLEQLNVLIPALVLNADPVSGAWYLVMSQPGDRPGNYLESSGSSMFVNAMLKSVRLGLVPDPDGTILAAGKKAYEYIKKAFVIENADGTLSWNGTVQVGSLNLDGSFDYYVSIPVDLNDLKGEAPFVMASVEYERL